MISTNGNPQVCSYRREVGHQKLGPVLLIASSLVLTIRTARWSPTHSEFTLTDIMVSMFCREDRFSRPSASRRYVS
jgi:hypothetical protein